MRYTGSIKHRNEDVETTKYGLTYTSALVVLLVIMPDVAVFHLDLWLCFFGRFIEIILGHPETCSAGPMTVVEP